MLPTGVMIKRYKTKIIDLSNLIEGPYKKELSSAYEMLADDYRRQLKEVITRAAHTRNPWLSDKDQELQGLLDGMIAQYNADVLSYEQSEYKKRKPADYYYDQANKALKDFYLRLDKIIKKDLVAKGNFAELLIDCGYKTKKTPNFRSIEFNEYNIKALSTWAQYLLTYLDQNKKVMKLSGALITTDQEWLNKNQLSGKEFKELIKRLQVWTEIPQTAKQHKEDISVAVGLITDTLAKSMRPASPPRPPKPIISAKPAMPILPSKPRTLRPSSS